MRPLLARLRYFVVVTGSETLKKNKYTDGQRKPYSSPFSRRFSCKTALLKWIFEADQVGVQIRAVSHFKGLDKTFKMR